MNFIIVALLALKCKEESGHRNTCKQGKIYVYSVMSILINCNNRPLRTPATAVEIRR